MFISPAFAQATGAAPAAGGGMDLLITIVPFIVVLGIMYVLVMRPQQQRMAEHKKLIANVRRGDTVITTGGIIGKVIRVVDDNEVQVEIADNVRVRLLRQMIAEVRSKGDTASKDAA